jgi:hypothetical protein
MRVLHHDIGDVVAAMRHVAHAKLRVDHQQALILRLRLQGHSTVLAQSLLKEYSLALAQMRKHLADIEADVHADQLRPS